MKIAILTSGRFHALDLARELDRLGHDVQFYSLVPPWQTARYGLPAHCNHWLGPIAGPAWVMARGLAKTELAPLGQRALVEVVDRAAARMVKRCDVFIGMSGMSRLTIERVKRRFGALTILERGSMHIREQQRILDLRPRAPGAPRDVADWVVRREEAEYELVDAISIPSRHVQRSFERHGIGADRLMVNPYGVSLTEFPATSAPPDPPRVLMTGAWSWRKGGDVLAKAFEVVRAALPTAELHHVGPRGDIALPDMPGFHHRDAVPQAELSEHYGRAHAFALASREDGFGLVLSQAIASGVPVVCSERTAGFDLQAFVADPAAITIVPPDDPEALAQALLATLARRSPAGATRVLLSEEGRHGLTWQAYGERWNTNLMARR